MDASGGNTLWVYSIPLNCSLKNEQDGKFYYFMWWSG